MLEKNGVLLRIIENKGAYDRWNKFFGVENLIESPSTHNRLLT